MAKVRFGIFVRLKAKQGNEEDLESFLARAQPLVQNEPLTTTWFALRFSISTFGIFDTFESEEGREAHLAGQVAEMLKDKASDLLAEKPIIELVDILAAKLPEGAEKIQNEAA